MVKLDYSRVFTVVLKCRLDYSKRHNNMTIENYAINLFRAKNNNLAVTR